MLTVLRGKKARQRGGRLSRKKNREEAFGIESTGVLDSERLAYLSMK